MNDEPTVQDPSVLPALPPSLARAGEPTGRRQRIAASAVSAAGAGVVVASALSVWRKMRRLRESAVRLPRLAGSLHLASGDTRCGIPRDLRRPDGELAFLVPTWMQAVPSDKLR